MTPGTVIRQAAAQGVWVALSPPDNIKVVGNENAVDSWLPTIREHKPGILADQTFAHDASLGFSGGDIAPMFPGSRFHIFDY